MSEIVTNSFKITPRELACVYRLAKRRFLWWHTVITFVITFLFIALSTIWYLKTGDLKMLKAWAPFTIIIWVWWIFLRWVMPYQMANDRSPNWELGTNFYVSVNSEFISFIGSDGSVTKRKIATLHRMSETKSYFIFFENRIVFYLLPFRAFDSPKDIECCRKYISDRKENSTQLDKKNPTPN